MARTRRDAAQESLHMRVALSVLCFVSACLLVACGGGVAPPAVKGTDEKPIDLAAKPFKQGDFSVSLISVTNEHVRLDRLGRFPLSADMLCVVVLEVRNNHQTRRLPFQGWGRGLSVATLADEHGNSYSRIPGVRGRD